jgi:hypothetical protein
MTDMSWYSASGGVLYADFGPYGAGANQTASGNFGICSISSGTFNNSLNVFAGSGFAPVFNPRASGVDSAYLSQGLLTPGGRNKIAASFKADRFARSFNGTAAQLDTSGPLPTGLNVLHIGQLANVVGHLNGILREIAFIPDTSIPDSALQRMTR